MDDEKWLVVLDTSEESSEDENLGKKNNSSERKNVVEDIYSSAKENRAKEHNSAEENCIEMNYSAEENSSAKEYWFEKDELMEECFIKENSSKEYSAMEETSAKEYSSMEETSAKEYSSEEETSAKEYCSMEETSEKECSSEEETSQKECSSKEETPAKEYSSEEKTSAKEYCVIVETAAKKFSSAEEAILKKYSSAKEIYSSAEESSSEEDESEDENFIEEHGLVFEVATINKEVCVVEIATVGSNDCGKTQLIEKAFGDHSSFEVDNFYGRDKYTILLSSQKNMFFYIFIYDINEEEFARREEFLDKTVVFFCYSVDDLETLASLEETWIPAIFQIRKPCFLVGIDRDPETKPKAVSGINSQEQKMVIQEKAKELCRELCNARFMLCSIEDKRSILDVFQSAINTVYPWRAFL